MVLTTGHLLRAVVYPDSSNAGTTLANIDSDSSDVVSYAYNAQGEVIATKDQAGNIITTAFDTGGRETSRTVTTLIGGPPAFDGAVRGIATVYDSRGMVSTVTQYDDVAMDAGDLIDQVKYTYDNWGNLTKFEQDLDSAVGTGANDYEVAYAYAKVAGGGGAGRKTIRRTGLTQRYGSTDKQSLTYEYLSTGNSLDDAASRLSRVKVSSTVVALYKYLGDGTVVNTAYPEADVFKPVNTATTGVYRMDNFGRITDDRWTKDLTVDQVFVELDISYDRNSNIVGVEDQVLGAGAGYDARYAMDGLDRLLDADEGSLVTGSITDQTRREQWTLSQTGNWHANPLDLDGDGAYTSVGDRELTAHAYSNANEWTSRTVASGTGSGTSSAMYTRIHDAVGNLIDDGEDYEYVYDPFGRLRFVKRTDNQAVVAEYRYNGLGFRVGWHYDVDADGTVESTSDDPWFFFAYDEGWRMVATYRSTDSSPKEQFVHHMAGMGGYGGSSYIDGVILRERDANTAWASAADGTLEERLYYVQNWRADVVAIVTDTGGMVEWVKYSAYGVPFALPAGDTDSDGDFDATDVSAITGGGGGYDVRKDVELDGDVDAFDILAAAAITGGYQMLGRDTLSSPAVNSRRGYAGYEYAPEYAGLDRHLFHVRHRVYDAEAGRWTRRDPLGYVDGMGLYEYVAARPLVSVDQLGSRGCSTSSIAILHDAVPIDIIVPLPPWSSPGSRIPVPIPISVPIPDLSPDCGCQDLRPNPHAPPPQPNGCGAKGGLPVPGWLIGSFTPCCNTHDVCYATYGASKSDCDLQFCACLMSACASATGSLPRTLPFPPSFPLPIQLPISKPIDALHSVCESIAGVYCYAVLSLGGEPFCKAKRATSICCDPPRPESILCSNPQWLPREPATPSPMRLVPLPPRQPRHPNDFPWHELPGCDAFPLR